MLYYAKDMQEWLDYSYPFAGYTSPREYYSHCNPMEVVKYIQSPCLFINAKDDPLCHVQNVYDNIHVLDTGAPGVIVVLTETGSHCSFYELGLSSWSERCCYEFFDQVLCS